MTTPLGPAARVQALRAALDSLGDALVAPAASSLMAAEAGLATAVAGFPPEHLAVDSLTPAARAALLADLHAAKAALERCRRLGDSLTAVAAASLDAHGLVAGYDRRGDESVQAPAGGFGVRG